MALCLQIPSFNSIKVQLRHFSSMPFHPNLFFQFHKGTIKARTEQILALVLWNFQFHKGTIKARLKTNLGEKQQTFNSIKVQLRLLISSTMIWLLLIFQFHKGTIKAFLFLHTIPFLFFLSIP